MITMLKKTLVYLLVVWIVKIKMLVFSLKFIQDSLKQGCEVGVAHFLRSCRSRSFRFGGDGVTQGNCQVNTLTCFWKYQDIIV